MPENIITIAELEAVSTAPDSSYIAIDNGTTTNKISVQNFNTTSSTGAYLYAKKSEGYALGTRDGVPQEQGEAYYHNNAKYFSEQAAQSAASAEDYYTGVLNNTLSAEAYASTAESEAGAAAGSATQANNAKIAAASSAAAAAASETAAQGAKSAAISASLSAEQSAGDALQYRGDALSYKDGAEGFATLAESYAVGGTNTRSLEDTDNAKYYSEQAAASALAAEEVAVMTPYIGENGNWYTYSPYSHGYVDSEIPATGDKGDEGFSPEVTIASITGGHTVTITDEEHPSGQSFNVMDGINGTNGTNGQDGEDGVSPEVTITSITGGHTVTITDAEHPTGQSFNVMDGSGAGDMLASTYDANSAVANAGGIAEYVKKSEGRYNVLNYGLVSSTASDTTTDNTAALNALLTLVPNNSVIFFPAGIYNFASGISLTKSVTFVGENEEVQQAQNTFSAGNERPTSILRYTGAANATMFTRAGYCDVNFIGLVLDGGNYQVIDNPTAATAAIKYEYCIDVPGTYTVNGIDVSLLAPGMIKNCMFRGFSGYAVRNAMHHYIEGCGFYWCNKCIVTTFTDSMLHDLWFCKCHTAIFMSNLVIDNPTEKNPQRTAVSVNVSDIWADQLTGHFIETDNGSSSGGFVAATSAQIVASNLWIDHVQMSAFYLPSAFLASSRISGTFGRIGMNYAGLQDSDRTAAIAVESDFLYSGEYVQSSIFELNISNTNGKYDKAPYPHNGECFSRLFTTMSSTVTNMENKITCTKFPVSRLIDLETIQVNGETQRRSANNSFYWTGYFGTDGFIEVCGGYNYINGITYQGSTPGSTTPAPAVGYLFYNANKRLLHRCTAKTYNPSTLNYTYTWQEILRGTQYNAFPNASPAQVGNIGQYVGTTNTDFTHGCFYECVNHGNNNCSWDLVPVQPTNVTIDRNGTASASATSVQRIGIDGSYTEIDGTKYMEQTITLSTSASVTATFTNAAILSTSDIEVHAGRASGDVSGSKNAFPFESIYTTAGSCAVTFPKEDSAISLKVRIYIR